MKTIDERGMLEPNKSDLPIYVARRFFEMIGSGEKTLELRTKFHHFAGIKIGDHIVFKSSKGREAKVVVTGLREYPSLESVLESEDLSKLAPGMTRETATKEAAKLFTESEIKQHGLVLFEFKLTT